MNATSVVRLEPAFVSDVPPETFCIGRRGTTFFEVLDPKVPPPVKSHRKQGKQKAAAEERRPLPGGVRVRVRSCMGIEPVETVIPPYQLCYPVRLGSCKPLLREMEDRKAAWLKHTGLPERARVQAKASEEFDELGGSMAKSESGPSMASIVKSLILKGVDNVDKVLKVLKSKGFYAKEKDAKARAAVLSYVHHVKWDMRRKGELEPSERGSKSKKAGKAAKVAKAEKPSKKSAKAEKPSKKSKGTKKQVKAASEESEDDDF
jgi:hypothetical protein